MLRRLHGWKTLALFSPVFVLSLLDAVNAIDLTPLLSWLGIPEASRSALLTALSLAAILLRCWTTGPVMQGPEDRR